MIRMILFFVVLSLVFGIGIAAFRSLTGKEKWRLTKLVAYSIMCMLATVGFMVIIVVLF